MKPKGMKSPPHLHLKILQIKRTDRENNLLKTHVHTEALTCDQESRVDIASF